MRKLLGVSGVVALLLGCGFYLIWMRSWGPVAGVVQTSSGTYSWGAKLLDARTEAGGASLDGKLYVVGGIDSFAQTYQDFHSYDAGTDVWTRLPDFPYPINHPGVTSDGRHIYVVGGFAPLGIRIRGFMFAQWDAYDRVFRYDLRSEEWTELATMPEPRGAGGVAYGEGKIWYAGGINGTRELSASLYCLDIAKNQWNEMSPMQYPRDHLRMEYAEGSLYAISGRQDDMRFNLPYLERFELETNEWSHLPDIPTPRGGFGSAVFDGKIYTFGGEAVWTCFDQVEAYNLRTHRWETHAGLPEARHGIIAAVIGQRIHLVSGGRHPRVSISGLHRIYTPKKSIK
jgi:N-acetylneuraminic acid mutarotase